jgi:hypothetical protein
MFSLRYVQRGYKTGGFEYLHLARVEAGSNTSIMTLRVAGGDEKGSLKTETVKYGHESRGTWTQQ